MNASRFTILLGGVAGLIAAAGACGGTDSVFFPPAGDTASPDAAEGPGDAPSDRSRDAAAQEDAGDDARVEDAGDDATAQEDAGDDAGIPKDACDKASDCYGKGIITPGCVGGFTCTASRCIWVCGPPPEPCGPKTICGAGETCCNASCGTCTQPDDACIPKMCGSEI